MKKLFFILFILCVVTLFPVDTFSQKKIKLVLKKNAYSFCGFSLNKGFYQRNTTKSFIVRQAEAEDKSGIYEVIEDIKKVINIETPFDVFIAEDEDNAFATTGENGKRIIIADQMFLVRVNRDSGTQWGAISILAHEIGHHIAGFKGTLEDELNADYWSGYALQKLGASKNASTKAIMKYGTEQDTESHPNKYSRKSTIEDGWDDAKQGTFDTSRCESCED